MDRVINDTIENPNYFKDNLKLFLDRIEQAQSSLLGKAQARGMALDPQMQKELLSKCLLETVNRKIFQDVYNELKEKE